MFGREQRRLAAIVAADIVGYSRLMGRDEAGTVARLRNVRSERLQPVLDRRGGRIVKLTGDGALIEFGSAVEALAAAIEFQQAMLDAEAAVAEDQRLVFRVGVHLGDVIVDGDDLYGDGVNIAARLEAAAPAGGIVVSADLRNVTDGRLLATFDDLGPLALKNIERPLKAYSVRWAPSDWPDATPAEAKAASATTVAPSPEAPLPLPDKPSIAVLPFQNMSGDPEQEYFADGMTEDILTGLSRFQNLFVIARNSSFAYKGKAVDVKKVGTELGVAYLLEGSIRAIGSRVRITAQLIDAATAHHVWAEHYDRAVADIFDIQDEVTARIVASIDFEVRGAEAQRPSGLARAGLTAWVQYHKALPLLFRLTREDNARATAEFRNLQRDFPHFATGHAALGYSRTSEVIYGWATNRTEAALHGIASCRDAVELDDKDAFCHVALGRALLVAGERDLGLASIERAVVRNPNSALAHLFRSMALIGLDRHAEALEAVDLAIRLSPRDPGKWSFFLWRATCQAALGDFKAAIEAARQTVRERPDLWLTHITLAITLARAQQIDEAKPVLAKAFQLNPTLSQQEYSEVNALFLSPLRLKELEDVAAHLGLPDRLAPASPAAPPDKPSEPN